MDYDQYGQMRDDRERRDRDYDRHRSQDRNRGQQKDSEPGFMERAGEEIRSWFSDDDNHGRHPHDHRPQGDRSGSQDTNRYGEPGAHNMGRGYSSDRDRSGSGGRDQSAFGHQTPRFEDRSRNRYTTQSRQSHGVAHDDDNGMLIYEEFSGTLGGFGNQTFGSTPDDHYRSWRDRQMAQLDDDYRDYCKTREQQFHSDFDTWRSSRQDQKGSNFGSSTGGDSNLGSAKSTGGASTPTRSGAGTSASKEPETASVGSNRTGNRSPS